MFVRTRLTLSFVLIAAAVLGIFAWTAFEFTSSGAEAQLQKDLQTRAEGVARSLRVQSEEGGLGRLSFDVFKAPATYVQFVNRRGEILDRSSNTRGSRLPLRHDAFLNGRVIEEKLDGATVYVAGSPVRIDGQMRGYAIVAQSSDPQHEVLDRLKRVLILGALSVLLLTGLIVWLMVRRALGPLVRLSSAATEIAAHKDHEGRVGAGQRPDEIGQLAQAIDRMLDALEHSHSEVQQANAAQRRFLIDVSHELRAPLTITMSSLELVQRIGDSDPEFRNRILADLRTDVSRMARMVTQLLIMARTGSATAGANRPVLLGDLLSDVCRQWSLHEAELNFGWDIDGVEDAVVQANEDYLRQLFSILLDNAFKFTPIGGRIKVEASQAEADVRVTVSDTGVGIAEKDLAKIFDRFYRASNGRSDGSGLGLAIARHIVDQHGGTIQADSVEGAGSNFTVTLPRVTG